MGSGALQAEAREAQSDGAQIDVAKSNLQILWPQGLIQDAAERSWLIYEIFSFVPWMRSLNLLSTSKSVHQLFKPEDPSAEFWRWLCRCLCTQSRLYLPGNKDMQVLCGGDYRSLLQELCTTRHHFQGHADGVGSKTLHFSVSTFCRVRPARKNDSDSNGTLSISTPVQLPLNQRVVLLQQKDPSLSRAAAMKMLINKECGAGQPLAEIPVDNMINKTENNAEPEIYLKRADLAYKPDDLPSAPGFTASILNVVSGKSGSVLTVSPGIGIRNWGFQSVFDHTASQCDVHDQCGLRLAVGLMNGKSGALIVYGQTGSGKTHTMFGGAACSDGLVSTITDDVLLAIERRREAGFEVHLGASYVEVFGNDITNLLGGALGVNRGQSQRMGHKFVLEGRCEEAVSDQATFQELLAKGNERKRQAMTEMNERSTRAHTLVILRLRQRAPGQEEFVESQLFLADLGGSEKVSKSKANENVCAPGGVNVGDEEVSRVTWQEYYRCRERITETNHINKGLLTLKRCVQALNERQRCVEQGLAVPRVPFNDSKLTMLLQPALTGESCTSVVVCCAPENQHAEETVQSLRFGEMCGAVEHEKGGAAKDAGAVVRDAIQRIDAEIKELESEILKKERWEWRQTKRVHVVDQMDGEMVVCNKEEEMELGGRGTVEIRADDGRSQKHTAEHNVWGQVLVGAEEENARRDELIKMRMKLLGDN